MMGLIALLLMLQPDFGSTILFAACGSCWCCCRACRCGDRRHRRAALGGCWWRPICSMTTRATASTPSLGGGTAFDQVDLAQRTLLAGGWTGSGLWLGTRKFSPARGAYRLYLLGDRRGIRPAGLRGDRLLYLAIVVRVLVRSAGGGRPVHRACRAGLTAQFGGQAFINILVNLQLFPSKGMTLPLISYGGSSTIALCLGVGLLLAITRRNPF
jgi:cell division protein FtsW